MDCAKTGALIRQLRLERKLTQKALAEQLNVNPKTVSKWECGMGCPDISLLPALSGALGVQTDRLLSGDLEKNSLVPGNMKQTKFYVCPACGSIAASAGNIQAACCGKALAPLTGKKAAPEEKLHLEPVCLGMLFQKQLGSPLRTHGMGGGRTLADLINLADGFHGNTSIFLFLSV